MSGVQSMMVGAAASAPPNLTSSMTAGSSGTNVGFSNGAYVVAFGSLTPNNLLGAPVVGLFQLAGDTIQFVLQGTFVKAYFTSLRVFEGGDDGTMLTADSVHWNTGGNTFWEFSRPFTMDAGKVYQVIVVQ